VIETPGGEMEIPTIITKEHAQQIKTLMQSAGQQAQVVAEDLKKKFSWWWLVAAGLLALWIFSGNKPRERKPETSNARALDGPKKKAESRKRNVKRSLPSLSI
jgi:hypothetical protein